MPQACAAEVSCRQGALLQHETGFNFPLPIPRPFPTSPLPVMPPRNNEDPGNPMRRVFKNRPS
jgi:hypothetical protein